MFRLKLTYCLSRSRARSWIHHPCHFITSLFSSSAPSYDPLAWKRQGRASRDAGAQQRLLAAQPGGSSDDAQSAQGAVVTGQPVRQGSMETAISQSMAEGQYGALVTGREETGWGA